MRVDRTMPIAFAVACVTLLSGAVGFRAAIAALKAYVHKEAAPLRESLATIPTTLGAWRSISEDQQLNDAMLESLGTKFYLSRLYAIDGNASKGWLQLHIAFYTGMIDAVPHIPERCFTAGGLLQLGVPEVRSLAVDRSGWREASGAVNQATGLRYPMTEIVDPITLRSAEVTLPIGDMALTTIGFQVPKDPRVHVIGGYLFIANGRVTPYASAVRALSFSLSEKYAYYCKVQFTGQYQGTDSSDEQYEREVADLLRNLLPQLMKRLPDWPEYEAKTTPPASASS